MAVRDTIIKFTTNTKPTITVKENSIDNTSTSLILYGKSTLIPAKIINTNLLYILENFCNDTAPRKPIEGQIWFNTSDPDAKHEYGRLLINIKDSTNGIHFHDIAGTVMNSDGNLRHTGQIEAVDDYNMIPQTGKDVYPENVAYKKYLTTKRHCDENYLSGYYSSDNSKFNVRGDRKIRNATALTFSLPGTFDDDQFKLINKKYLDSYFLNGQNFNDHFIIPDIGKKLYYTSECLIDLPYQLVTKKFVSVQDLAARDILDKLKSDPNDGLEKYVIAAEADAAAAEQAAAEAWAAVNSIHAQTVPSIITIVIPTPAPSGGGTVDTVITGTVTMMDVSTPTVNSYMGINTHPYITGLLTTEPNLAATATYTITIDGVAVPPANIVAAPGASGVDWTIDSTYLNWAADTKHTVVVTRIEDATHSYVSTGTEQIVITSLLIPTVNTQTVSTTSPKCTITGTIGSPGFNVLPITDNIKVVFNSLTYYRYNDPTSTQNSAALTVTGGDWTLTDVPTPNVGQWDVVVTRNDNAQQIDATTNEITVASLKDAILPTVTPVKLIDAGETVVNCVVTGKVGSKNLSDSSSTFTVQVLDGTTPITGTLTSTTTDVNWTYTIASIATGKTYNVVATRTDEYNNTFIDNTTNELVIQRLLDTTLPTVVAQTVTGGATVNVTGTVGSIKLADSNSTFSVKVTDSAQPTVEETGTLTYDASGLNWTYALTTVPEGKIYDVTATRTDEYGNKYTDTTSKELNVKSSSPTNTITVNGVDIEVSDIGGQHNGDPTQCLNFCNSLVLYGHSDWRVPTIDEMKAIYDQLVATGIDTKFVKISGSDSGAGIAASIKYRNFWASIVLNKSAWYIDMTDPSKKTYNVMQWKNMYFWVRAVRTKI